MGCSLYFTNEAKRGKAFIQVDGDLSMSYSNARDFVTALGFSPSVSDDSEVFSFADLEEGLRIFQASEIAQLVDGEKEMEIDPALNELTKNVVVVPGIRPEGYLTRKVAIAVQMCEEAKSKGATLCYFA